MSVITRFAPSPTGFLHVGGARTALYSYLYAKRHGGKFILRIEDTDRARFSADALRDLIESLRWLGLAWDEGPEAPGAHGPYIQSERADLYKKFAAELLDAGHAYRCFCTTERLETMRRERGDQIGYDRACRGLDAGEAARRAASGEPHVLRFKMPLDGSTNFEDAIRGFIEYPNSQQDDFVVMKTDGFPTYHLANVVDDHLMEVTHVMRGEEWIPSTPKHIRLYEAFGWTMPVFAHLPVILSPDGGKLSKRHGAVSVREYRADGFLPDALINYLALLGWSPGDDREIMTIEDMTREFEIARVNKRGAIFDKVKLTWMNGRYITALTPGALESLLAEQLAPFAITDETLARWGVSLPKSEWLAMVLAAGRDRAALLPEIIELTRFFLSDEIAVDPEAAAKNFKGDDWRARLAVGADAIRAAEPWSLEAIEREIRGRAEAAGFKPPKVMHPLRVAVTGRGQSPGLFETVFCVGRARSLERIARVLA
jgi:glutamyl-tRNA synthetase